MSVISEEMASLINQQVAKELSNRLLYLQISSWAHNQGLKNISAFFKGESDGEQGHADKFLDYLREASTQVSVPPTTQGPSEFADCETVANLYIERESATTQSLKNIWAQSVKDNDIGSQDLLQWYMREQIEEEGLAERFGDATDLANGSLIMLDLLIGEWA